LSIDLSDEDRGAKARRNLLTPTSSEVKFPLPRVPEAKEFFHRQSARARSGNRARAGRGFADAGVPEIEEAQALLAAQAETNQDPGPASPIKRCTCEVRKFSKIFCGSSLVRMFLAKLAVLCKIGVNTPPSIFLSPLGGLLRGKEFFPALPAGRRLIDVQREGLSLPALQSALRGRCRGVCNSDEVARLCGSPRSARAETLRRGGPVIMGSWRAEHRKLSRDSDRPDGRLGGEVGANRRSR